MPRLVRRCFYAAFVALFLVQASGMTDLPAEDGCEKGCPDDDDRGNCPPDCTDCVCCVHGSPVLAPAGLAIASALNVAPAPARSDGSPLSADARRIEHVPKSSRS